MRRPAQDRQQDQRGAGRADNGQGRNGNPDQAGQADVGYQERGNHNQRQQDFVTDAGHLAEQGRRGRGQADRCDGTGQINQHGHEEGPGHTHVFNNERPQDLRPVLEITGLTEARADLHQAQVDGHQPDTGKEHGGFGVVLDLLAVSHAFTFHAVDDDHAEGQRGERVHGQVAIHKVVREGFQGLASGGSHQRRDL